MSTYNKLLETVSQTELQRETEAEIYIARPPNCFMLWSCEARNSIYKNKPSLNNSCISTLLGKLWMELDDTYKLKYKIQAEKIKHEHKLKYPNYKYAPKSKIKKMREGHAQKGKRKYTKKSKNNKNTIKYISSIFNTNFLPEEQEPDYFREVQLFYEYNTHIIREEPKTDSIRKVQHKVREGHILLCPHK